jgi:hypothetical protein
METIEDTVYNESHNAMENPEVHGAAVRATVKSLG